LLIPCPPSLLKALHPSNPDRHIWFDSYNKEKGGLERLNVFERINKKTYLSLKRSRRIGKALPSMCVLVIKPDRDGNPVRAKSRIVVLAATLKIDTIPSPNDMLLFLTGIQIVGHICPSSPDTLLVFGHNSANFWS
jgi:hypothetical protein